MQSITLGKTGLKITPVSFGAFKLGRNQGIKYPKSYDLPSDAETERILNRVLDLGVGLIDTAPAYGLSEERIGQFVSHRRDEFCLSTKTGETFLNGESHYDYSAEGTRLSVERSLKRLRTQVLDLVLVHSNGRDVCIQEQTDVVPTLQRLKEQGKIRAIGFSGKQVTGAQLALHWADVLMIEYHIGDSSHSQIIEEAQSRGIGVLVKKGLASGHLAAQEAIRFVLGNRFVDSMVIGGINTDHLAANCHVANGLFGQYAA